MVSPHAHLPLISALTTFYRLLVDLRHVPEAKLLEPSWAHSGQAEDAQVWKRHPPHSINAAAAHLHGFSDAAVDLAYHIPYITEDYTYIYMETEAISYLRSSVAKALEEEKEGKLADWDHYVEVKDPLGEGMDGWDYARDPTYQERTDLWAGRDVLLLTIGHIYGTELVYDLTRQTITSWYHFRVEHDDFDAVPAYPMTSPDNPLYVWIRDLLTLRNLAFESRIFQPHEWPANPDLAHEWHKFPAVQRWEWEEMVKDYDAERDFANVYIEYGWDPQALDVAEREYRDKPIWERMEQSRKQTSRNFRGNEFEAYRETWLEEMRARRQQERQASKARFEGTTQSNEQHEQNRYDNTRDEL
ncbi:hypothetical protein SBRCBS47491_003145 [Sporothrix bragantina]|uniref:Uncharacterized protein n=1 Tax=Sporothrix bragantina TaxID=671064 RepID=A0ABP0BCU1_9PEZI